jgi:hypothetical protein
MVYNVIVYYCFDSRGHNPYFRTEIRMTYCLTRVEYLTGINFPEMFR